MSAAVVQRSDGSRRIGTVSPVIRPLLLALAAAALPHVTTLPAWISLWCAGFWIYAWQAERRSWKPMLRWVRLTLAFLGFFGVMATYRGAGYSDTYLGILAVMAGIKPLEVVTHRDRMITLFLAYFLVVTTLLFTDELLMTLYMVASVWITTMVLVGMHHPRGTSRDRASLAFRIILQALPITLILFYLFPRIQGNVLGLTQAGSGRSGFSDQMSPGGVSGMAKSDAIAFRVTFDGAMPPYSSLYWRGITFDYFDGRTWSRTLAPPARQSKQEVRGAVTYELTLEPHNQRWLFALEQPSGAPDHAMLLSDDTILSRRAITERRRYRLSVVTEQAGGVTSRQQRSRFLLLPPDVNPRARQLAKQWAETLSPAASAGTALAMFRQQGFVYTLKPPILGRDGIDEFLFDNRRGYCEHYASAFVFLMRAAGIPARVVGGYQGGEMNPYGDYLIVRQSHAHAWAEIWLEDRGWVRVDPTAAVAPDRVERGLGALSAEDLLELPGMGMVSQWLSPVRYGWDVVNSYWILWVLSYSAQDQAGLLSRLGLDSGTLAGMFKGVLLGTALIGLLLVFYTLRLQRRRVMADPARQEYDRFLRKLEAAGVTVDLSEGPVDLWTRLESSRPDLAVEARDIVDRYVRLRYAGDAGGTEMQRDLARRVAAFSPERRKPDVNPDAGAIPAKTEGEGE